MCELICYTLLLLSVDFLSILKAGVDNVRFVGDWNRPRNNEYTAIQ
jgi:hypothetical protein